MPEPGETAFGEFFDRVRGARRRGLLLDYDGTLAPLSSDRRRPVPYPGIRAALVTIALAARPTSIWIVSGRTVADLARLIRLDHFVDLFGSHGMERRTRHGCWAGPAPSRSASEVLDEVTEALRALGAADVVERKMYGLAIHGRGTDRPAYLAARRALVRRFAVPAAKAGLVFAPFNGGVELRPAGFHKGLTVDRAFEELGADAAVAYLGDDQTDEDAFAALGGRGLPVLVGDRPRPTLAAACLRAPAGVLDFLSSWNTACSSPPA